MTSPFTRSLAQCEAAIRERNDSVRAILEVVPNPQKALNSRGNTPISGVAYSLKDTWKMPGFNRDRHEWQAGGAHVTPSLLDNYGPLTEIPQRGRAGKEPGDA